jgi:tRNA-dihydrouridine synthase B
MQIGCYSIPNPLILAPMAGITDRPFRTICKTLGAGLTVSEMVATNPLLREHKKTRQKANNQGEPGCCSVQILGTDPQIMAEAALFNVNQGAQIIDINMGCPAKKVCAVAAGSALMKNTDLVTRILDAVVNAVPVPVTLKIRTGWDRENRNAVEIAQIAENAGISALTVHGRTRACKFEGDAEYETIKHVKSAVNIPVIANGDIDSPEKATHVLAYTGANAVMIGRAAQGNPWLFQQVNHYLKTGNLADKPKPAAICDILFCHLEALYSFYGAAAGVKIARKHIGWYLKHFNNISPDLTKKINRAEQPCEQFDLLQLILFPHLILSAV